jgi:L-alanine-DL-glutamate epimerase-like enolase superfamily enzyme
MYTRQSPDELDALREEVQTRVDEGFSAFKLKMGEVDPEVDAERIRAVREIAGDDAQVFADAQGVWNLDEAIDTIERFEDAGMDGIETPCGNPDAADTAPGFYYDVPLIPDELATIREETDATIFEHVHNPEFGLELVEADAVDVFTVECVRVVSRGLAEF